MGTTGDFESTAMKNVTVKRFNTIPEAFQELKNGGVAAVAVSYTHLEGSSRNRLGRRGVEDNKG